MTPVRTLPLLLILASCSFKWEIVDVDGDGASIVEGDCDDQDSAIGPHATEVWYDGVDQDCDGLSDFDADGDGYNSAEHADLEGVFGGDCDDNDAARFPDPSIPEIFYNCVDDNCDLAEGDRDGDQDGDGFVTDAYAGECGGWEALNPDTQAGDCWDDPVTVPADFVALNALEQPPAERVYPGADDAPYDGVDAACDGEGGEFDADGDGFNSDTYADRGGALGEDCDDAAEDVNPDAAELCSTSYDDDCDGDATGVDASDCVTFYEDGDGDGFGGPESECRCEAGGGYEVDNSGDCDDGDGGVNPDAEEVCDGVDNDCDGGVDVDAVDAVTLFADSDGDGFGDAGSSSDVCEGASGYVDDDQDCDDSDADIFPGSTALETPFDGDDQDCDGDDFCTDLSCDGLPDLVYTSHRGSSNFQIDNQLYFNTGAADPFSDPPDVLLDSRGTNAVAAADIDGDGYIDLVFANYENNGTYLIDSYIYWGGTQDGYGGNNGQSERLRLSTEGATGVVIEDLDGDGDLDVLMVNSRRGGANYYAESSVYWGSSLTSRSAADVTDVASPGALAVASGDLDGDGLTDLVFAVEQDNTGYQTVSYIYWGGADATDFYDNSGAGRTELSTDGANDVKIADIDGDGFLDVIVANRQRSSTNYGSTDGVIDTDIYWGDGSRGAFEGAPGTQLPTLGARELTLADLDADGLLDVFVTQYKNAAGPYATSLLFMQDSAGRSFTETALSVSGARRAVAYDVNLDGALDLVIPSELESDGSSTDRSWVYWGDASSPGVYSDADRSGLTEIDAGSGVAVGDVNGDGYPDLCFSEAYSSGGSESSSSTVYQGRSAGTFIAAQSEALATVNPRSAPLIVGNVD